MKKFLNKTGTFLNGHQYLRFLLSAFFITFLVELFSRKSVLSVFRFMANSPLTFFINVVIIMLTLSVSMFFSKSQRTVEFVIGVIWISLGIANCYITSYRMTPFSAEDLKLIPMLGKIAKNYVSKGFVVTVGLTIIAIVVAVKLAWKYISRVAAKAARENRTKKQSLVSVLVKTASLAFALFLITNMGMQTQALSENYENLAEAYEDYGFAYCFSNSIVDVGISKPGSYTEEKMNSIASSIRHGTEEEESGDEDTGVQAEEASYTTGATAEEPNIIMIQLESFFDPLYIRGLSYSEDPIPTFRYLKEHGASGFLTVPVVGAGTANTEFEILTGMSTDYFGAGEYPYNTILKSNTCESLPFILKKYGYSSSAIHNNTGTFYNRNLIFSNLGFDNFTSEEFMYNLEETPNNWSKDNVLPENIMERLQSTDSPDFIYTITVQSHGRYPSEKVLTNPEITVSADENVVGSNYNTNPVEYYVNEIHEVDEMVSELIDQLNESGEPTIVVMYGDHLPALGFDEDDLKQPSLYQTEYVIWNNFGLTLSDENMQAESLGTYLLKQFGMDDGILPKFHEAYDGTEEYSEVLELLEYDMLYGEGYIYDEFSTDIHFVKKEGENSRPYQATDLSYGTRETEVYEVKEIGGEIYVYGKNFNESTRIVVDDKVKSTEYLGSGLLKLSGKLPEGYVSVSVAQCDRKGRILGESSSPVYYTNVKEKASV